MCIGIVFNPYAGPRQASATLERVQASLGDSHETVVLDGEGGVEQAVRAAADTLDRLIVIGGDGTLNLAVNGIMTSSNPGLPLAFVPTGRGRDTSRTLPSWSKDHLGSDGIATTDARPIDLIKITMRNDAVRYGVNISDVGLAAHAADVANRLPRGLRTLSYVLGAVRAMAPLRPFRIRVTVDGQAIAVDNALLLSVCNGKSFGGGIQIEPLADAADGLLNIVIAQNANLLDLGLQLPKLKRGKLLEHRALKRWHGKVIELEPVSSEWFEVDGESLPHQPRRFEVSPHPLNWISPS